ncbi:MAG TPA: hypothetical protein VKA51_03480, partial [Rubrobacteraceae bacterium]|nr:hypothetical protein [Rubrobacteraceae bacterium]
TPSAWRILAKNPRVPQIEAAATASKLAKRCLCDAGRRAYHHRPMIAHQGKSGSWEEPNMDDTPLRGLQLWYLSRCD